MEHFIGAFKKYADFSGRARRQEYWMFVLIYILIYIALMVIDSVTGMFILTPLFALAIIIPSISIAARRLHDTGRSGWWQLIAIIPLIGGIILLVFLVQDSHDENEYGPSPKQAELA
ncbi:Integral membrane protein [hydrothermal vent metagenome]|uniref:Integral membrane protein n=1 Tax=hydrothermal vent metagenome TaxID=652676 RepID=A0A3B0XYE1_9ZZZZ